MIETWQNLPNEFGTHYEISNYGNIRNRKGKYLVASLDERGYPRVRLSINNLKKSYRVHRLVGEAFIENPNNYPQINHKDGIKTNNHYSNLEWCTNSENQKHAIDNGLKITKSGVESYRFKASILVFNLEGQQVDELFGNKDMKAKGFDFRNISAVVNGKRKTYKKLIFKRNE